VSCDRADLVRGRPGLSQTACTSLAKAVCGTLGQFRVLGPSLHEIAQTIC
jgi:hypothetical protein